MSASTQSSDLSQCHLSVHFALLFRHFVKDSKDSVQSISYYDCSDYYSTIPSDLTAQRRCCLQSSPDKQLQIADGYNMHGRFHIKHRQLTDNRSTAYFVLLAFCWICNFLSRISSYPHQIPPTLTLQHLLQASSFALWATAADKCSSPVRMKSVYVIPRPLIRTNCLHLSMEPGVEMACMLSRACTRARCYSLAQNKLATPTVMVATMASEHICTFFHIPTDDPQFPFE